MPSSFFMKINTGGAPASTPKRTPARRPAPSYTPSNSVVASQVAAKAPAVSPSFLQSINEIPQTISTPRPALKSAGDDAATRSPSTARIAATSESADPQRAAIESHYQALAYGHAVQGMAERTAAIEEAGDDKDAIAEATAESSEFYARQVATLPPDLQENFLDQTEDHVATLVQGMDELNGEQNGVVIDNLTIAGEHLGQEDIRRLTDIVAREMPGLLDGHKDNDHEMLDAIRSAIEDGNGVLFGAGLAESLHAEGFDRLSSAVASRTSEGIETVMGAYETELGTNRLNNAYYNQFGANLHALDQLPEATEAAKTQFIESNFFGEEERAANYLTTQEDYASLLEGASYISRNWNDNEGMIVGDVQTRGTNQVSVDAGLSEVDSVQQEIDDESRDRAVGAAQDVFEHLPSLMEEAWVQDGEGFARGNFGSGVIADAVLREANGESTFLGTASNLGAAGRFEDAHSDRYGGDAPTTWLEQLDASILYGGAQAAQVSLLAAGGLNAQGIRSTANVVEALGGLVSEASAATLGEMATDLYVVSEAEGVGVDELFILFDKALSKYGSIAGVDVDSSVKGFSSAVSLAGGVLSYIELTDPGSLDALQLVVGSGAAGVDMARVGVTRLGSEGLDESGRLLPRLGQVSDGLGVVGDALGLAKSVDGLNDDYGDIGSWLDTVGGGSTLASGVLKLAGSRLAPALSGIGSVFLGAKSLFDAQKLYFEGNTGGAAVAALPALAMGLGWLVGGPPGAAIGLGLGSLASMGLTLVGVGVPNPEQGFEEATEEGWKVFLQMSIGDSVSESTIDGLAGIIRNTDEDRVGMAPLIALLAESTGRDQKQVLIELAELVDLDRQMGGWFDADYALGNGVLDIDPNHPAEGIRWYEALIEVREGISPLVDRLRAGDSLSEAELEEYDRLYDDLVEVQGMELWLDFNPPPPVQP